MVLTDKFIKKEFFEAHEEYQNRKGNIIFRLKSLIKLFLVNWKVYFGTTIFKLG
jgi:hypothetical protein